MPTPIQIVLIRDRSKPESEPYRDALRLAFEGSGADAQSPTAYLDDAVDLQIQVLEPDFERAQPSIERLLAAARDTLVVEILPLPHSVELTRQLDDLKARVGADHVVSVKIPDPPTEGDRQRYKHRPDEVEPTLMPVVTALRAMETARLVLADSLKAASTGRLKFFVSHAKIDGIPMALSLLGLMRRIREASCEKVSGELRYFYDVEDIEPGSDWRAVLEENARNSVLIVLRTEEYEKRYWCRQEYLWAEQMRCPILVVDLRTRPYQEGARLPFGPAPQVHVHDGNLIRVLLHAIACHLRPLRLEARIQLGESRSTSVPRRIVLPRHPSEISLHSAVKVLRDTDPHAEEAQIIYPNPPLHQFSLDAVQPILDDATPKIRLITPDELEDQT